ncbi:hypothetical protein TNIN_283381 [Trichonephila inaurata madagascariensis]|uniref:Uncharacterized protein n=1 Tax=Trichonephila inaurata madagascariensis TaxID=2747483 RepID=A0A8X7C8S9_9ARAC|nr:hypothetical protein TNIN_283381 [Trichonephila inaurata madagascariensis]
MMYPLGVNLLYTLHLTHQSGNSNSNHSLLFSLYYMICPLTPSLNSLSLPTVLQPRYRARADVKSVIRPISPKWMLSDAIMARQPAEWIFELPVVSETNNLKGPFDILKDNVQIIFYESVH